MAKSAFYFLAIFVLIGVVGLQPIWGQAAYGAS